MNGLELAPIAGVKTLNGVESFESNQCPAILSP